MPGHLHVYPPAGADQETDGKARERILVGLLVQVNARRNGWPAQDRQDVLDMLGLAG